MEAIVKTSKEVKTEQKISLIDGHFTASEAADIINSVLNVKINFHKLNRLSITEGNASDNCEYDSGRIDELLREQIIAKEFFAQARLEGKKLKMNSTIHISVED
ncbi:MULTISPECIES: hypothetical protein [Aquimarina]|uniref:Uncharacterized protein n=1 Tax=Aquimarina algiphila TaxID=2047982 RepID=A0A554VBV9_9FLAO|nr:MULTISPECIES: hypothetical protein [Aquimarina]TSE04099.1 hypothetical protein FOF46_27530 [Aquimarina algiphila]